MICKCVIVVLYIASKMFYSWPWAMYAAVHGSIGIKRSRYVETIHFSIMLVISTGIARVIHRCCSYYFYPFYYSLQYTYNKNDPGVFKNFYGTLKYIR